MTFCGIPIFFQEVAMGQYLGAGGMTLVSQLCPMLKGVGVATMTVVFYLDIYYCVIIAWTFFYLFAGFSSLPDLPWDTCGEWSEISTNVLIQFPIEFRMFKDANTNMVQLRQVHLCIRRIP